jgi:sulfur relay (sulfurtransferase) complex TusBCD TusD component (DsrE family)
MSERATQVLIIVNDGPYESERSYNALRLAMNLSCAHRPRCASF